MKIVVGMVMLLASACGAEETRPPAQAFLDDAAASVCRSLSEAEAGDEGAAEKAFHDGAHGPLHDLAEAVGDREVKAELLEAKSRVERGDHSAEAFASLERAIGAAAEAADLQRPDPCGG